MRTFFLSRFAPAAVLLAMFVVVGHGPTLPPDPWAGFAATPTHGPTLPPDPWAGRA